MGLRSMIELKYGQDGLIPAIVQEADTGEVLMLAYMTQDSLRITFDEGYTCFYSRSRQELWRKGETSGNRQKVVSIAADCDADTLLIRVKTDGGPACHTGSRTCFDSGLLEGVSERPGGRILEELYTVIEDRKENPKEGAYTTYLFAKGQDKILKKVGEEASEVIIASKNNAVDEIVYEMGDLFYHCMVLLANHGIRPGQVFTELERRRK